MLKGAKDCRFTKMNATDKSSSVCTFRTVLSQYRIGDFGDECGNFYSKTWSLFFFLMEHSRYLQYYDNYKYKY